MKYLQSFLSYFKTLNIGPAPGIETATFQFAVKRFIDWANPATLKETGAARLRSVTEIAPNSYHRFYAWTVALSDMVFVHAQKLSSIMWIKYYFSCSVHVGDKKHGHVSINDTSVAWTALRESANRDRRDFLAYEHRRDSGRLKQLADVFRFLRRASKEAETRKATEEFLPYDEQYRVSDPK